MDRASGTAKRVDRLIALLLFPRLPYGCGFGLSAGFLLGPNIPNTLPKKPFFFSASAGGVPAGAPGGFAGLDAAEGEPEAGGGVPFLPKRCDSQFPWARCPACNSQSCVGSLPETKYSVTDCGQVAVASWPLWGSIFSSMTPGGGAKGWVLRYCGNATARFMNSAQTGAADALPDNSRSRLSSNPIQTTHSRFEVNPTKQPSREVPVFPAAGAENPIERTVTPVPRLITSSMRLVTRYATRESSTPRVRGPADSSTLPSAASTLRRNSGSERKPLVANAV